MIVSGSLILYGIFFLVSSLTNSFSGRDGGTGAWIGLVFFVIPLALICTLAAFIWYREGLVLVVTISAILFNILPLLIEMKLFTTGFNVEKYSDAVGKQFSAYPELGKENSWSSEGGDIAHPEYGKVKSYSHPLGLGGFSGHVEIAVDGNGRIVRITARNKEYKDLRTYSIDPKERKIANRSFNSGRWHRRSHSQS